MCDLKKCENCDNDHNGDYGSGRFCSSKCPRGFSTKAKRSLINEKVSKKLKLTNKKCISCLINNTITNRSKYCTECKTFSNYKTLFLKLKINNQNYIECNIQALQILFDDYFKLKLSKPIIMKKYNLMSNTIFNYFKLNGIELRNLSESTNISIEEGRYNVNSGIKYKHGKHNTWENKIIYYRSSYELDYALLLDSKRIKYDVEKLRIKYFDNEKNKERYAIPDFYLIDTNTIVEIKSVYTLNEKNMRDKLKAYTENGYNFKLILDKKEVTFM